MKNTYVYSEKVSNNRHKIDHISVPTACSSNVCRKGMHAAPGRQVSTWVHAVKAVELSLIGGSFSIFGLCFQFLDGLNRGFHF
jgi:hypothetical protein